MNEVRLMIVDRDSEVRKMVKSHAIYKGYIVDEAADGITALKLFRRNRYNTIIIDRDLPELAPWQVCRQIRKSSETPIIILSSQTTEEEKLSFFDEGIDDFLNKPFSCRELMARIHVILRHSAFYHDYSKRRIIFDGLCIDVVSRRVYIDGHGVILSPKEYKLLVFLAKNPAQAFTREMILDEVWGRDFFGTDRTVDTHIKTLREHIKPYHELIKTVWGFGYMFNS